jgi:hypothetical protein
MKVRRESGSGLKNSTLGGDTSADDIIMTRHDIGFTAAQEMNQTMLVMP